jgi:hypothetical protein
MSTASFYADSLPDDVKALYRQWAACQPLPPENEARLWQRLRLEWNYSGSHMDHIQNPTCLRKPLASFGERVCKA